MPPTKRTVDTPARMSDVARLADVSAMTVSRVLSHTPTVAESIRARVLKAVKELNYRPNDVARMLRDQRSLQIGMLVPHFHDPFIATAAEAVSKVAKAKGRSVILATSNEDACVEFDEAFRMYRRSIEGLIVFPAPTKDGRSLLKGAELAGWPIVSLDRPVDKSLDSVTVENARGMTQATRHLIDLGHKRIVYIGLDPSVYTMRLRQQGYEKAMKASQLTVQALHVARDFQDSFDAVSRLMRSPKRPTAIVTANNVLTRHVLRALNQLGWKVPKDVAIVGFDDFEMADLLPPGITVLRQPSEEMGRLAAEALFARIDNVDGPFAAPARSIRLSVEFIVRGSCGVTALQTPVGRHRHRTD